jgi:hypothetical protein
MAAKATPNTDRIFTASPISPVLAKENHLAELYRHV